MSLLCFTSSPLCVILPSTQHRWPACLPACLLLFNAQGQGAQAISFARDLTGHQQNSARRTLLSARQSDSSPQYPVSYFPPDHTSGNARCSIICHIHTIQPSVYYCSTIFYRNLFLVVLSLDIAKKGN